MQRREKKKLRICGVVGLMVAITGCPKLSLVAVLGSGVGFVEEGDLTGDGWPFKFAFQGTSFLHLIFFPLEEFITRKY